MISSSTQDSLLSPAAAAPSAPERPSSSPRHRLLVLSEADVQKCWNWSDGLEANRRALIAVATGQAHVPTRLSLPHHPDPQEFDDNRAELASAAADCTLIKPATYAPFDSQQTPYGSTPPPADNTATIPAVSSGPTHCSRTDVGDLANGVFVTTTDRDPEEISYASPLLGLKVIALRSTNPSRRGLPLAPATLLHLNPTTGLVEAVVTGTWLTAARTAACSAWSCRIALQRHQPRATTRSSAESFLLSCSPASSSSPPLPRLDHLVVFGAGLQAELHIQAISMACCDGQPLERITIINRSLDRALELQRTLLSSSLSLSSTESGQNDHHVADAKPRRGWAQRVEVVSLHDTASVAQALSTATVVVAATNTTTPLFSLNNFNTSGSSKSVGGVGDPGSPSTATTTGRHWISVGSYTPHMQEFPLELVRQCEVWVDTPEARSVGDLKDLPPHHPVSLLGSQLLSLSPSSSPSTTNMTIEAWVNRDHQAIADPAATPAIAVPDKEKEPSSTLYKSVGTAVQDVLTVHTIVQRAKALGVGTWIDMSG